MFAALRRIDFPNDKRVIAISDVHGNLSLLKKLLQKVGFCEDDALILVGDFLEKGTENLATLRYVMGFSNAYALCGNCDDIWLYVRSGIYDKYLLQYLIKKRFTLTEMCEEIGLKLSESSDINIVKAELERNFPRELDFLQGLPHIIDTNRFTFAHAGLENDALDRQPLDFVMKNDAFLNSGRSFDKYVVVGHWPVVLYGTSLLCCNPVVREKEKIIGIDGGNMVKNFGQLNAMVIPKAGEERFYFVSADNLEEGLALREQEESEEPFSITWADNRVIRISTGHEFSLCRHISSGVQIEIPNDYLLQHDGAFYTSDVTDYRLPLKKGDKISIVELRGGRYLAKKDGVVGWGEGSPDLRARAYRNKEDDR